MPHDPMTAASLLELAEEPSDPLERILQLANEERHRRLSPRWQTDMDAAMEAHGEAVERLYAELAAQLDARESVGAPVQRLKRPPDPRKEAAKEIIAHLKTRLPAMIAEALDDL